MSWLFSRALVVGYCRATFSDGVSFARLNEKKEPDGHLWQGRMMEPCVLSQSGMTFAPLTDDRGAELLMWCRAGFRVKPIAPQLRAKTMRTISGRRCNGSWQMSLPGTYLPRTLQKLSSMRRRMTSKRWVTKPEHFPLVRQTWVVTTFGSDIGYLHTPTTKANYCAHSMQKWPAARAFHTVFGRPSPENQEWLMGWPEGWSDTAPLGMGKYQLWQQAQFDCLRKLLDAA